MQSGETRNEFYDFIKELKQMSDIAIIEVVFRDLAQLQYLLKKDIR